MPPPSSATLRLKSRSSSSGNIALWFYMLRRLDFFCLFVFLQPALGIIGVVLPGIKRLQVKRNRDSGKSVRTQLTPGHTLECVDKSPVTSNTLFFLRYDTAGSWLTAGGSLRCSCAFLCDRSNLQSDTVAGTKQQSTTCNFNCKYMLYTHSCSTVLPSLFSPWIRPSSITVTPSSLVFLLESIHKSSAARRHRDSLC